MRGTKVHYASLPARPLLFLDEDIWMNMDESQNYLLENTYKIYKIYILSYKLHD
jgi:hypothetical protein